MGSTLPKTSTFRLILTLCVFQSQRSSLMARAASPQGGERISSELLAITRLFSRRSTCQLLATTSARPPSGPPGLARGSSLTTLSSALGVDGKDTCKGDGGSPLVCQSKFAGSTT